MIIRSQNIECDIYTQTAKPVHFVQGEKGREIMFTFVNSAIPIEDEPQPIALSGLTATIHILKPDGNFIIDNMTISGNAALYVLTENACAAGGAGVYDVSLSRGSDVVYTAHGAYVGDFRAISDDVVNSVSEAYGVIFPEGFQEKLIAGENITIIDNVISSRGGGGDPATINATASVDATTGTPSVTVTKTTAQGVITFNFAFSHLKGETGAQGPQGETGATGPQGPAGPGVASGGTAGQVLTKVDGTDYNTTWATPQGGGVDIVTEHFTGGTGALNRSFTLPDNRTPSFVKINGYTDGNWSGDLCFKWGESIAYGFTDNTHPNNSSYTFNDNITYDNNTFTLVAYNAGCAFNTASANFDVTYIYLGGAT